MAGERLRRPSFAQYRWMDAMPCPAERVPTTTAEAILARGWAEVEDVYRYRPATAGQPEPTHRLVSSTLVLTGEGRAVLEAERQRQLTLIGEAACDESEESETR